MSDEHVLELLPAYALDALEDEEQRIVAEHLRTCTGCREDLVRLRGVTDSLAAAVLPVSPPAALRRAVLNEVRGAKPRQPRNPSLAWVAVAAALIAALAAGLVSINQRLQALQARLAAQEHALALLTAPASRSIELSGSVPASVRFVFSPGRQAGALIVTDLRDPGRDLLYQLWLIGPAQPESAGVFRPRPDRPVILAVSADFGRYQAVAISVERAPLGATQPTAAPILVGRL